MAEILTNPQQLIVLVLVLVLVLDNLTKYSIRVDHGPLRRMLCGFSVRDKRPSPNTIQHNASNVQVVIEVIKIFNPCILVATGWSKRPNSTADAVSRIKLGRLIDQLGNLPDWKGGIGNYCGLYRYSSGEKASRPPVLLGF